MTSRVDFFCATSVWICLVFLAVCSGKEIGEPCTNRATKGSGVCEIISKCGSAKELLSVGGRPTVCGFDGHMPIVCCEKKIGEISKQKCQEYGKHATEKVRQPDGSVITISRCIMATVSLIVDGTKAQPREFPHQALIGYGPVDGKTWECGGSLISEKFVVTAAHCSVSNLHNGPPKYIRLGDLNIERTDDDAEPEEFDVVQIIIHPRYNPPSQYNDIALLKMDRDVIFKKYIRPACLQITPVPTSQNEPALKFIATGWGRTDYAGDRSADLLKVVLEHFPQDKCRDIYQLASSRRLKDGIVESQICAGGQNNSRDTCQGDSGGPLQITNKDVYCTYNIVGITSFGKSCGAPEVPGVYTRVSHYIDWIEQNVWS